MQVSLFLQNLATHLRASTAPGTGTAGAAPAAPPTLNRGELLAARRHLVRVLDAFEKLDRVLNGEQRALAGLPSARSNPALSLNLLATAARLNSVAEINATPTSFNPFVPAWGGSSSALLNINGIYDGSDGTGALTFEVRQGGVHGTNRLRIRVRNPQGGIISNLTIRESDPIDQQYSLSNGLFITLGAGSLVNGDATSGQVFDSIGSVVDPDKPLGGTGNDNPNLEYGMPAVVDGSFQLNGVNIAVAASDSLNDVLDTINQAGAGVTATFNVATERIELAHDTPGSAGTIDIQGDDSNFVQATKLDAAIVVPGTDPDDTVPLQTVAQFASVQSGDVVINGTSIAVDVANDSLEDIIDRINASDAGVTASFDSATQRAVITGQNASENLTIDGNGTGLFGALNMPEGQVDRVALGRGYSRPHARLIADAVTEAVAALNGFFRETKSTGPTDPHVASLRSQLKAAFTGVLGAADGLIETGLGIDFHLDGVGARFVRFAYVDRGELMRRLQTHGADAKRLFSGAGAKKGLLQTVVTAARRALDSSAATLETKGTIVDARA